MRQLKLPTNIYWIGQMSNASQVLFVLPNLVGILYFIL